MYLCNAESLTKGPKGPNIQGLFLLAPIAAVFKNWRPILTEPLRKVTPLWVIQQRYAVGRLFVCRQKTTLL